MAESDAAKKKGTKAKAAGEKPAGGKGKAEGGDKDKKKNPLVIEARQSYLKKLRSEGGSDEDNKKKLKVHMKDVVRPAMNAAKTEAEAKKLKGPERKKFVQEFVRTKLGLSAQ